MFHKEGRRGGRLTFAVMVTEFRDRATGKLVAEARMTGVETEKAPEAGPMTARWDELTEGAECAAAQVGPLTRTDFVRYQGASGDMNPVHHDETFARPPDTTRRSGWACSTPV